MIEIQAQEMSSVLMQAAGILAASGFPVSPIEWFDYGSYEMGQRFWIYAPRKVSTKTSPNFGNPMKWISIEEAINGSNINYGPGNPPASVKICGGTYADGSIKRIYELMLVLEGAGIQVQTRIEVACFKQTQDEAVAWAEAIENLDETLWKTLV